MCCRGELFSKINKRAGTFIRYSRVRASEMIDTTETHPLTRERIINQRIVFNYQDEA